VEIHQDCRYFKGDIPCSFHKKEGVWCSNCKYYSPVSFKVLIIKLDAPGDVLRTTCILQGLKEKYPNSHITWITKENSLELFENNPYIDCLLNLSFSSYLRLQLERYNLVLSLDSSLLGSQIASLVSGDEKLGFGYSKMGFIYPFNKEAEEWYKMGISDPLKRANKRTYQEIVLDICRLRPKNYEIIFRLTEGEKEWASNFKKRHNISGIVIGLNTGGGERWKNKKWTDVGFLSLISLIKENIKNSEILLLGGPGEKERNRVILEKSKYKIIDTGCNNTIREFGALVSLCDIVVTGDTLALHIACALGKMVVALFGPTSPSEIFLYNKGRKIHSSLDCLCCYKTDCNISPNCMELIKPEEVFSQIQVILKFLELNT